MAFTWVQDNWSLHQHDVKTLRVGPLRANRGQGHAVASTLQLCHLHLLLRRQHSRHLWRGGASIMMMSVLACNSTDRSVGIAAGQSRHQPALDVRPQLEPAVTGTIGRSPALPETASAQPRRGRGTRMLLHAAGLMATHVV